MHQIAPESATPKQHQAECGISGTFKRKSFKQKIPLTPPEKKFTTGERSWQDSKARAYKFWAGRCCMFLLPSHTVLIYVGCMEHSDSKSDFELHEVGVGLDGLSDEHSVVPKSRSKPNSLCSSSDRCSGAEAVAWICSYSVCLQMAQGCTDFGKMPGRMNLVIINLGGGAYIWAGGLV